MKFRLPLLAFGLLAMLPVIAQSIPATATTTKKSAIAIGSGSFALVKGTKLEVIGREGDTLVVKYRAAQGKIPLADTDFPADAVLAAPVPATVVVPAPAAAATPSVKPVAAQPATAPALTTSASGKQPATHYGKAVQKAKQATEAHKSTHVDPTKGIMDDEPAK